MHTFAAHDGLELAYRELGTGRPLVLLHGFGTTGSLWVDPGPAAALAERGHRVIIPDFRGHGASARPRDPAAYPPDVLADDGLALIERLGLADYDLGGYSLGARIVLRMLVRGARPARAIVAGQGLDAINRETSRTGRNRRLLTAIIEDAVEPGSPAEEMAHWLARSGNDPRAILLLLDSLVLTAESALAKLATPILVVVGEQDHEHATADALAAALPGARFTRVPGDHFTTLTSPELAAAMLSFLDG